MREATGTVYGDIGTSVLYTVMEITRETIRLKHHVEGEERLKALIETGGDLLTAGEALGGLSLVFWALDLPDGQVRPVRDEGRQPGRGGDVRPLGAPQGVHGEGRRASRCSATWSSRRRACSRPTA